MKIGSFGKVYKSFVAFILVLSLIFSPIVFVQRVEAIPPLVKIAVIAALAAADVIFTGIDAVDCVDGDDMSCAFFMGSMYLLSTPIPPGGVTTARIGRSTLNAFERGFKTIGKNVSFKNLDEITTAVRHLSNSDKIKVFNSFGVKIAPDFGDVLAGRVPMMNYGIGRDSIGSLGGMTDWHHLIPAARNSNGVSRMARAMEISERSFLAIPTPPNDHRGTFGKVLDEIVRTNFGSNDIIFTKNNVKSFVEDTYSYYRQLGMEQYAIPALTQFINSPGVIKIISPNNAGMLSTLNITGIVTSGAFLQAAWNSIVSPIPGVVGINTNESLNFDNVSPIAGIPRSMVDVTESFAGKEVILRSEKTSQYFIATADTVTGNNGFISATKFQVSNVTSDGWVGFLASNGKYVQESDSGSMLKACGDNLKPYECMRIYEQNGKHYIMTQKSHRLWKISDINNTVIAAKPVNQGGTISEAVELVIIGNPVINPPVTHPNPSQPNLSQPSAVTERVENRLYTNLGDYVRGYYTGEWRDRQPNGEGTLVYDDLSRNRTGNGWNSYAGNWIEGRPFGYGKVEIASDSRNYEQGWRYFHGQFYGMFSERIGRVARDVCWHNENGNMAHEIVYAEDSTSIDRNSTTMNWTTNCHYPEFITQVPPITSLTTLTYPVSPLQPVSPLPPVPAPPPIPELTLANMNENSVSFLWPIFENSTGYHLIRDGLIISGGWPVFGEFVDTTVEADTTYEYWLQSFGDGRIGNSVVIITPTRLQPVRNTMNFFIRFSEYENKHIGFAEMDTSAVRMPIDSHGSTPHMINGQIFLPVRPLVEQMGGTVDWDNVSEPSWNRIKINIFGRNVDMWINHDKFYIDGQELIFSNSPRIINGVTMVPARVLFEAIGCTVEWVANGGNHGWDLIAITYFSMPPPVPAVQP